MKINIISSGSKGNAYIIEKNNTALLVECGVKFGEIQKAINFDMLKIKACVVSHEHLDHSKAWRQVIGAGIPMFASAGTYDALKVGPEDRQRALYHGAISGPVKCFKANHDAAEPLNFIIDDLLFITDNYKLQFDFSTFKFTCVMIEANYCEELIKGKADDFVNKRRFRSHMSFQTALLTLKTLDLSECKQIILIHLSDGYTDEKRFIEDTEKAFGIPTICADKNQVIEL
ncbi:MAG: phage Pascal [Bacteroidota bacterium]|jgi:phosphoribosyl 1,2-cyclic phosphodiesterase